MVDVGGALGVARSSLPWRRRVFTVVAWPGRVDVARFCTTLGLSLVDGGSVVCSGRPLEVVVVVVAQRRGRWWVATRRWLTIDIARLCTTPEPLGSVDRVSGGAGGASQWRVWWW
jgi:hypothetical protein